MSGLVDNENTGCSMLPMSALGTASTMSQTNISCCGCLSGNKGFRCFVTSHTHWNQSIVISHTLAHVISHTKVSSLHTPTNVTLHTIYRHFTHHLTKNIVKYQMLAVHIQWRNSYITIFNYRLRTQTFRL